MNHSLKLKSAHIAILSAALVAPGYLAKAQTPQAGYNSMAPGSTNSLGIANPAAPGGVTNPQATSATPRTANDHANIQPSGTSVTIESQPTNLDTQSPINGGVRRLPTRKSINPNTGNPSATQPNSTTGQSSSVKQTR
jgi:hypothetical protein